MAKPYHVIALLLWWPSAVQAQSPANQASQDPLLGATVLSRDDQIAGAVDGVLGSGGTKTLVIGLSGYLGAGEKDVAVPADRATRLPSSDQPLRRSNAGQYGGGGSIRIKIPMSIGDLVQAQPYRAPLADTGVPSSHVGSPAESIGKPPSSTHSGGPG